MKVASLHNHSTWSDGETSIGGMAAEARRLGVNVFGISDHYTLQPSGEPNGWSMPLDRLCDYVEEVRSFGDIKLGIEADYFPETIHALRDRLREWEFHHVIGSVHYVDGFPIDSRAEDWAPLSQGEVDNVWRGYWERTTEMARSRVFTIAAHLDLPKKFGFRPSADLVDMESAALAAIAETGMTLEINTNGWNVPAAEQYPSERLLRQAVDLRIPLIISSDAHRPSRILDGFDRAESLARRLGNIYWW